MMPCHCFLNSLLQHFKNRTFWKRLLLLLSMTGFLYQTHRVSDQYFRYETKTRVNQSPRLTFKAEDSVFCTRYYDVLHRERLFRETGINVSVPSGFAEEYEVEGRLTVDQIFRYTPAVNESLDWCSVTPKDSSLLQVLFGSDCYHYFSVSKYFTQRLICYLFAPKSNDTFKLTDITQASVAQYVVYELSVSQAFRKAAVGFAMLTREPIPLVARHYSKPFPIRNTRSGQPASNWISMRSVQMRNERLPRPYDTACDLVPQEKPILCKSACLVQEYGKMDRMPAQVLTIEPLPVRPLATRELDNRTIADTVQKADMDCSRACSANPCVSFLTFTSIEETSDPENVFHVTKLTPGEPDLETFSQPNMEFNYYYNLVSGCIGVWFGVSFLSLDFFRWPSFSNKINDKSLVGFGRRRRRRVNMDFTRTHGPRPYTLYHYYY